jgi:hypothetical protein
LKSRRTTKEGWKNEDELFVPLVHEESRGVFLIELIAGTNNVARSVAYVVVDPVTGKQKNFRDHGGLHSPPLETSYFVSV